MSAQTFDFVVASSEFGSSRYYVVQSEDWFDAQRKAELLGGNLVTINSAQEQSFIQSQFAQRMWIGLYDSDGDGRFNWISGSWSSYRNWQDKSHEPHQSGSAEYVGIQLAEWDEPNVYGTWDTYRADHPSYSFGLVEVVRIDTPSQAVVNVWDNRGGNYDLLFNDLPGGYEEWWASSVVASRFKTAAVELYGWSPDLEGARELRLVDLETGRVMAGRPMMATERLLFSHAADTTFYIGEISGTSFVVRGYDYSLAADGSSLVREIGSTQTYLPPSGQSAEFFKDVWSYQPPAQVGQPAYFQGSRWNSATNTSEPLLFRADNDQALRAIPLPALDYESAWPGALAEGGFLWLQVYLNESNPGRNLYFKLSVSNSSPQSSSWQSVANGDDYWDVWDRATGAESVVRDGIHAYDLSAFAAPGTIIWRDMDDNSGVRRLPDGKLLVIAEMEPPTTNARALDIGHQHWFVFESGNATPVAQKAFTGQGQALWSVRAPEDGFQYFEVLNVAFQRSGADVIGVTQPAALATTLYRVPLSSVESVLASSAASPTLAGRPGVETVASFSQSQLSGGRAVSRNEVAVLDGYLRVGDYLAGNEGVLINSSVHRIDIDDSRYFISRLESNGAVTRSTEIQGELEEIVVDRTNGVFVRVRDWHEGYDEAFHVDFVTGQMSGIPQEYFWKIAADGRVPEGVLVIPGTSAADALGNIGQTADQWLLGGSGNDDLFSGQGDDLLAGGDGFDRAFYSGARGDYRIERIDGGERYIIEDLRSGNSGGVDTVYSIERVYFSDGDMDLVYSDFRGVDLNGHRLEPQAQYTFSPNYYWGPSDWTQSGYERVQPNIFYGAHIGLEDGIQSILISPNKTAQDLAGVTIDWRLNWHQIDKSTGEIIRAAPVLPFGVSASSVTLQKWVEDGQYRLTFSSVARTVAGKTFYDLKIDADQALQSDVMQDVLRSVGLEYRHQASIGSHDHDILMTVKVSSDGTNYVGASEGQAGVVEVEFTNTLPALSRALFFDNQVLITFEADGFIGADIAEVATEDSWLGHPDAALFAVTVNGSSAQVLSAIMDKQVLLTLDRTIPEGAAVRVSYSDPLGDQVQNVVQTWDGRDAKSGQVAAVSMPDLKFQVLPGAQLGWWEVGDDLTPYYSPDDMDLQMVGRVVSTSSETYTARFLPDVYASNLSFNPKASSGIASFAYVGEQIEIEAKRSSGVTYQVGQSIDIESLRGAGGLWKTGKLTALASNNSDGRGAQPFDMAMYLPASEEFFPNDYIALSSMFLNLGNDFMVGNLGADRFSGRSGDDTLMGGAGDDTLEGGLGNDSLDGGAGIDTALYSGPRSSYVISTDAATGVTTVRDTRDSDANEGVDLLRGVEFLDFADERYALPTAGKVEYRDLGPVTGFDIERIFDEFDNLNSDTDLEFGEPSSTRRDPATGITTVTWRNPTATMAGGAQAGGADVKLTGTVTVLRRDGEEIGGSVAVSKGSATSRHASLEVVGDFRDSWTDGLYEGYNRLQSMTLRSSDPSLEMTVRGSFEESWNDNSGLYAFSGRMDRLDFKTGADFVSFTSLGGVDVSGDDPVGTFTEINGTVAGRRINKAGNWSAEVLAESGDLPDQISLQAWYQAALEELGLNSLPTSSNLVLKGAEDSSVVVNGFGFKDADKGDVLSAVKITELPGKGRLLLSGVEVVSGQEIPIAQINSNQLRYAPQQDGNGVGFDSLRFQVGDGIGFSQQAYVLSFDIAAVNDAPVVAKSIASQQVLEGADFVLRLDRDTFTDVDGDTLTYRAVQANNKALPKWLKFDANALEFSGRPGDADSGVTLSIRVIASDKAKTSAQTDFSLAVQAVNVAPTVAKPITVVAKATEGRAFSFVLPRGTFVDPDRGDVLTYSLDPATKPLWLDINSRTGQITGSPDFAAGDTPRVTVTIIATDKEGLSASTPLSIDVANVSNIRGTPRADSLVAGAGNDRIDGLAGADTMAGGLGDDTYVVDNAADVLVEAQGEGTDTVLSSVAFTLPEHVENLTLTGRAAINGTGNALNNAILGNAGINRLDGGDGDDTIDGGLGNDTLIGGAGKDTFRFSTALGKANIDVIQDFVAGEDRILLDAKVFRKLLAGGLGQDSFVFGQDQAAAKALDANDHIIFNAATGALFYDADGNGKGAMVQFATLAGVTDISASNIFIA